ncbi:oxidoreductase [Alicycliphilus denitrificans]|uniref:Quinone oxidoreductase, YhdH/YhfP family n=2 Tax=Alicycliphilus denitrificans TaxID=179636 RepID=F4G4J3_ALIDK|nr:MDR family oxidoreductase [Alicycliphilus denitrificans]ADU98344.1 quinone oxidoreductase, YhdH/YhfP family [Alicycliphilus denitrificans BC]AEB82956.1 quinone oxidoreductase, YhdH/YhfP family [Alicycliphilus denitrificans K601]QKD42697.1 oxidoreductase [Alicycliphilus denitrificans]
MFKALLLTQPAPRETHAECVEIDESRLPEGTVRVAVSHSTLNYKDALAITGRSPVVRQFPMVPGIDFAGTVIDSEDERFRPGDAVLLNGWGVGETHWGGLAQQARVNGDWLIRRPEAFSAQDVMAIGTAGYTAMLCVMALQDRGVAPADGPVLVTGANGGVGSIAVALLARLGFEVHASTGRPEQAAHLQALGAAQIVERGSLDAPGKPLQKERWAAAVDSVGSHTLANVCASVRYGGCVAACGLAQGMDLPATVAPFILRGVSLLGIDSVYAPVQRRERAWQRLAQELPREVLQRNTEVAGLADVVALAPRLLAGQVRGRVVVDTAR